MTGPNTVEWTPIRNVHRYSSGALCSQKPAPPISITTISKVLTKRVSIALSYLSAIWPEVAENSTNGRMKIAEIRNAAVFGIDAGKARRLVRDERREADLEDVVVHRAEELRPEKRREAALAQQAELGLVRVVTAGGATGGG